MEPKTLRRYVVDRARGITSAGLVEVVVLSLETAEGQQFAVCLSKVDALQLGTELRAAAFDAAGH